MLLVDVMLMFFFILFIAVHQIFASSCYKDFPNTCIDMAFSNAEEGSKLILSSTEFAFDLFRKLNTDKKGDNVFLSPTSISMALAMTYLGKYEY